MAELELTLTPSDAPEEGDGYIGLDEAAAYAADESDPAVTGLLAAWNALTGDQKTALLVRASDQIDSVRWQGRRYDTDPDVQGREFPRLVGELPSDGSAGLAYPGLSPAVTVVWDWDADANAAVVPERVERATWQQALSLLDPTRTGRLDDRHDGVASQSAAGQAESYDPARPAHVLCRRAWELLSRYRLRTGRIV